MVKIDDYENYFFCPKSCEVYSVKSKELKKIKPLKNRGSKIMYCLYLHGARVIISKFDIMKKCVKEIEKNKH